MCVKLGAWVGRAIMLGLTVCVAACAPSRNASSVRPDVVPVAFKDVPGWSEDRQAEAVPALLASCEALATLPPYQPLGPSGQAGTPAAWGNACAALAAVPAGDSAAVRATLEAQFRPYAVRSGEGDKDSGLFTGYYEAELRGSLKPDAHYTVPLYRVPDDLISVDLGSFRTDWDGQRLVGVLIAGQHRLAPYPDRSAIDGGALQGRGLELVWVDDAIGAFFMQIQGSGVVTLPDGKVLRLSYAAQNGLPYVAIGNVLVEQGELSQDNVTMQSIRAWLESHPREAAGVMDSNPSYIFFHASPRSDEEGPIGSAGVALTAGRSVAVDPAMVGYHVPVWLDTTDPENPTQPLRRLVVAQDSGGAIHGPVRGDVFWGHGAEAERKAGLMQSRGRWFILLPVSVTPERSPRAS